MQQLQINHSADLQKLQDEGYDLEISGGKYLLVHHIPYVTFKKEIKYGTLVCILNLAGTVRLSPPSDHTIYFQGETPCDSNGVALNAIINNSNHQQLTGAIIVNHYFSSKPASGNYENYYQKIRTYSEILLAQAKTIDASVTSRPNRKTIINEYSV
jgi:hypothetical protein